MSCTKSEIKKKCLTDTRVSSHFSKKNNIDINGLNDDCLGEIFTHLAFNDRVRVERVCKRWRSVIRENWTDFKSISSEMLVEKSLNYLDEMKLKMCIRALFMRCGSYLRVLDIDIDVFEDFDISYMLTFVIKYCTNLEYFKIDGGLIIGCTDCILQRIFCRNKNLTTVAINTIIINGYCLKSLNSSSISRLEIMLNETCCSEILRDVFQNFNNLRIFSLNAQAEQIHAVIKNIDIEHLEELQILRIINSDSQAQPPYEKYFKKMLKLQSLNLHYIEIKDSYLSKTFEIHLKKLTLSYFEIDIYEDFLKALKKLINLEEILLLNEKQPCSLNDDLFQTLRECKNLKIIILIKCPNITEVGLITLNILKGLQLIVLEECPLVNEEKLYSELENVDRIKIKNSIVFIYLRTHL